MRSPVSHYVLKVHSRCDLACNHCYVYQHADQSWRIRSRALDTTTADLAAQRIAEHAAAHQLPEVQIVLHGGEPLLLGKHAMREVISALVSRIAPVSSLDLRVHTNGVRLDERWCRLFDEYGVKVGVSLDGDRAANDRHRTFADGRSSYRQVTRALSLLRRPEFRHLYSGILCTVDLANDPVAVYLALAAERPPRIDFLLPHATWENPPYRPAGLPHPYADWLIKVYMRWVRDGRPVPIRLFDSILSVTRGGTSWTEAIGLDPVDLLVIETDGSWEQADSLKTAFDGAAATGMRVQSDAVDDVARHPGVAARQGGLAVLCGVCQACPVVRVCGGGLYAHRYRAGTGFDNPSVYCADLKTLISQISAGEATVSERRAMHGLPVGAFDALAAGPGNIAAMSALAQMRLSLTRVLVAAAASPADAWRDQELMQAAAAGWELLCKLDAEHPAIVAEIFSHPYTHAWAVRCLSPPAGANQDLDRAHVANLAAAAAMRARQTAGLSLPVRDGMLHVPTVGALAVGDGAGRTRRISVSAGHLDIAGAGRWHDTRHVDGPVLRVIVEDLDPFRDCQQWPAADRLNPLAWLEWRRGLASAGQRLADLVPPYAQVLVAGLRAVVPLRPDAAGQRSGTARQAFGAVAAALPPGSRGLDALLIHEFQHVKLNALLDLYDLFDARDTRRLPVPWRGDARPVEGVLHGTYAYLALAHLRMAEGPAARDEYLRYRSWVCQAASDLLTTGALTRDGEHFVAAMSAAAESGRLWSHRGIRRALSPGCGRLG
jgi:uncharacterized protein